MLIGLSEQRLSRWATIAAAASFILPLLGLLLMFGAFSAAGDYGITSTQGFWTGGALSSIQGFSKRRAGRHGDSNP